MPTNTRIGRFVPPFATITLAGGVLLLATACDPLKGGPAETEERTDTYNGVSSLVVDHEIGSVSITRGDKLTVDRTLKKTAERTPTEKVKQNGSTLTVGADCPPSLGTDTCEVDYKITVPSDATITVKGGANSISVTGVKAPVDVTTDSGAIEIDGVDADVKANTKAGRVTIKQGASGKVEARSDSGAMTIRLNGGSDPVTAAATSGDIKVTVPGDTAYHVTTKAKSGKTEVNVKQSTSGVPIDVTTDSGDITVTTA